MSTSKAATLRHSILAARDYKIAAVEVPEWNHLTVHVRTRSLLEALAFEEARETIHANKLSALFLTYTLCDEDGVLVFVPGDPDAVDDLCGKDPGIVSRVFNEALALENPPEDHAEKP